jgi:hypothetical protein
VLTVDDNLITPATLPAVGTTYANWLLGQRERTMDTAWDDYVFTESIDAAPGRRAFVFGKSHGADTIDVPFETVWNTESYRWPAVVIQQLKVLVFYMTNPGTGGSLRSKFFIKSATENNSLVKIERFQNAVAWTDSDLRHPMPITDDLDLSLGLNDGDVFRVDNCLHGEIRLLETADTSGNAWKSSDPTSAGLGFTIPATNFTDWTPFVLRDQQRQSKGLWVREKVTVFPPINAKRKMV